MHNGETVYVDYNPATIVLGIDPPPGMGSDDVRFTIEAGKTYFMAIAVQAPYPGPGIAPYPFSQMKAGVHQFCGGGFCTGFVFLEEAVPVIATTGINPGRP